MHVCIGTVVIWGFGSSQQFSVPCEITRRISELTVHQVVMLFQQINGFFALDLQKRHFHISLIANCVLKMFLAYWWTKEYLKNYSEFSGGANYRSKNCSEYLEEQIITHKFATNYRAQQIIVRQFTWIGTIGITKMQRNSMTYPF